MGQLMLCSVPIALVFFLVQQYIDLRRNIKIAKTINVGALFFLPYPTVLRLTQTTDNVIPAPIYHRSYLYWHNSMVHYSSIRHSNPPLYCSFSLHSEVDQVSPSLLLNTVSTLTAHSLLHPYWTWYEEYKPFQELGSETFVTVAPGGITFHTCCPEFIRQVGDRRKDFQKPLELYGILNT